MDNRSSPPHSVMFVNVQSLVTHIDSMCQHVLDLGASAPQVIAIVESQNPSSPKHSLFIDNYSCQHFPSPGPMVGGGTVLYIHTSITVSHQPELSLAHLGSGVDVHSGRTSSIHWFDLHWPTRNQSIRIAVTYLSPGARTASSNDGPTPFAELITNIESVVEQSRDEPVIICGDFNLRSSSWDNLITNEMMGTEPRCRIASQLEHCLLLDLDLTLLNNHYSQFRFFPTRHSQNGPNR